MERWEKIGQCPVDAGCLVLVDPCYVKHGKDGEDPYKHALTWQDEDYRRGHKAMAGSNGWPFGVIVSTGYGDGSYDVYIKREPGSDRIAEVKVVFIPEEDY